MAVRSDRLSAAEHRERRINEHRAEVERLRAEFGDPAAALRAFLRDHFDPEALGASYQEYVTDRASWLDRLEATEPNGRQSG